MLTQPETTVLIRNAEALVPDLQHRLADWLEQEGTARDTGDPGMGARLVLVCAPLPGAAKALVPALARRLQAGRIQIPPLRERPEDVPALARHRLAMLGVGRQISADGYRLLLAHAWPGNNPELFAVIDRAVLGSESGAISAAQIAAAIGSGEAGAPVEVSTPAASPLSERDWLMDALRRNRFRRGDTAAYLGISRKTLYNKMHRFGLLE